MNLATARVRHAVKKSRCTQKEVAQALQISEQYLSDILSGKRTISVHVALRLESVLGLDATKLLHDQVIDELREARSNLVQTLDTHL